MTQIGGQRTTAAVAALLGWLALGADAGPSKSYTYALIATDVAGPVTLNDRGQVAYYSSQAGGPSHTYLYDGGASTLIINNPAPDSVGYAPALNNSSAVVANWFWDAPLQGWNPAVGAHPVFAPGFNTAVHDISESGRMAVTRLNADYTGWVLSHGVSASGQTPLKSYSSAAGNAAVYPATASIGDGWLTGSDVAVAVFERNALLTSIALRLFVNGSETFAVTQPDGYTRLGDPEIEGDALYFSYEKAAGVWGIMRYRAGQLSEVLRAKDWHGGDVAANASGLIAFRRSDSSIIYTASAGGPAVPVVGRGDALFDGTISAVEFSAGGLNASGQIAFTASMEDGRSLAVLATPIPEPGPLTGLAIAAGVVGGRRRYGGRRHATCVETPTAHDQG